MSKLSERLTELKEEHDFTSAQLASLLQVDVSTVNRFLRAERTPEYPCFINLLNVFNCSADYLLGRVDIPGEENFCEASPFHIRLRQLLKDYGISQEKLKHELNISSSLIYRWLKGISQPLTHTLILLADYFDCSVDFLIGRVR